jgi:hypothetical protein
MQGKPKEAEAAFRETIRLRPDDATAYFYFYFNLDAALMAFLARIRAGIASE